MIKVSTLTFNDLQTNTYILSDESNHCAIIDPACKSENEKQILAHFIQDRALHPEALWFTHLHFDHIYGARFVIDTYNLRPMAAEEDIYLFELNQRLTSLWGIMPPEPFDIKDFITEDTPLTFGNSTLRALLIPGHTAGGLAFVSDEDNICFSGDSLFRISLGRTDIGGTSEDALIDAIRTKLFALPDNTIVYPGHGPTTTIGDERHSNPYFL